VKTGGGLPGDDGSSPLDFLHHNMKRTSLNVSDSGRVSRAKSAGLGNVLAITEEDYAKPTCEGQGSLQTWRITSDRNADGTIKLELLDLWTTELNELANLTGGSPATVNCSAHWFDVDGSLLAQGWYDQGVRFMDISNPRDIQQVGYHVTQGTFWAALLRPDRPGPRDRLRARHDVGPRRAAHRAPGRRHEVAQEAGERVRAERAHRVGHAERALGLRLPAAGRAAVATQSRRLGSRRWTSRGRPLLPLAARLRGVESSPVREILALTERPGMISFAGGLPAPELFDATGLPAGLAER